MDMLLQMCIQGSAMIAAVLVLRALLLHRLPKATFYLLWAVVLVRLLVPVSITAPVNAWTLVEQGLGLVGVEVPASVVPSAADGQSATVAPEANDAATTPAIAASETGSEALAAAQSPATAPAGHATAEDGVLTSITAALSPWTVAWAAGSVALAGGVTVLYLRNGRHVARTLPVDNPSARQWLAAHPLRRGLRIRESAETTSPFTCGVLRPTIVVPVGFDWRDPAKSTLVLEHEFVHAARFDVAFKALLAAAVCLYWFDPLVWAMFAFANRDLELSCDERVARRLNAKGRSLYAHALIDAAERRGNLAPAFAGTGRHAIGERIASLSEVRPATLASGCAAALLALAVASAFATSVPDATAADTGLGDTAAAAEDPATVTEHAADETAQPAGAAVQSGRVPRTQAANSAADAPDNEYVAVGSWRNRAMLTTPYYRAGVPYDLFPAGFDYAFSRSGGAPAPDTATNVLTVTDRATGEVALVFYCYPRDPNYPQYTIPGDTGEIPGFTVTDRGRSEGDYGLGCAVAVRAGYENDDIWQDGSGTMNRVYGFDDPGLPRDAYRCYAVEEQGGTRIVTPYYSVLVPAEFLTETFACDYTEASVGPDGDYPCHELILFDTDNNLSIYIYCATDVAVSGGGATSPTGLVTSDGLNVYVIDGSVNGNGENAATGQTSASWISLP